METRLVGTVKRQIQSKQLRTGRDRYRQLILCQKEAEEVSQKKSSTAGVRAGVGELGKNTRNCRTDADLSASTKPENLQDVTRSVF